MLKPLENLDSLTSALFERATASGVEVIVRAQSVHSRGVQVRSGKTESSSVTAFSGHGVQVLHPSGYFAIGSRDDFDPQASLALTDRLIQVAAAGKEMGLTALPPEALNGAGGGIAALFGEPVVDRAVPESALRIETVDLNRAAERLIQLESLLLDGIDGVSMRMSFRAEADAWRICRTDGADVLWVAPRCTLVASATGGGDGGRHGVSAALAMPDPDHLFDDERLSSFLKRARDAAKLTLELGSASSYPAGSHPLVIDYALAKGLAHEAFGHASEADGFRSSILAENGKFQIGRQVGPSHVSIIDEPIEGDHAWQPFSSNGLRRERSVIVDHGKLRDALSDPWSAGPGGVPLTGAARAESFRNAPQPRMTNIRIEVDSPLPAPGEFEDYGPEEVRDLLLNAGVFDRHPEVAFLSGYSGGQVSPATGDFVFNCKAIYALRKDSVKLHRPAIFSGSMFGALGGIREAFGPLRLDAIGSCGKWGQSVPSSGGSHYFLVLEPDPTVRLGGA